MGRANWTQKEGKEAAATSATMKLGDLLEVSRSKLEEGNKRQYNQNSLYMQSSKTNIQQHSGVASGPATPQTEAEGT